MEFKNVDEILLSFAQYVVDASKENLKNDVNKYGSNKAGGDLDNSLSYTFDKSQDQFLLDFLMEDYGVFVDKGVKGKTSTYPETKASLSQFQYGSGNFPKGGLTEGINEWMKKKRFQWRTKDGRFMSYESMSYIIARSIYNKGLKANLFFTTPFEAGLRNLPINLKDAFKLDIENAIIFGEKK
jgi:hypothetical protein